MYAVDGAYNYSARHPGSPPLSVNSQQEYGAMTYNPNTNQYIDEFDRRDGQFGGYVGSGNDGVDLSFTQNNQVPNNYDFNFRSSNYPDDPRGHLNHGTVGSNRYVSSPYGSNVEGSYGVDGRNNGPNDPYNARHELEMPGEYPLAMSSQQNLTSPLQQSVGSRQYPPYYGADGRIRNDPLLEEPVSDQLSSTREELNPLDERFSEQDMNPLDERFSDIDAMNHYRPGGGVLGGDNYNNLNDSGIINNWNNPMQRRDENFGDGSLRDSMIRLSIQDHHRPTVSPSPYTQPRINNATPVNMPLSHSPASNSQLMIDSKYRNPDLREVIDYLNHQSDAIKANAAAYLQHLSFMDDNIKAQTRVLRGIPILVDLVNNPLPEVHRSACGALRNLSYGRANDENKREIKNAGGITVLVRLLRKTTDSAIQEVITGILWNLSSCADLKKPIIDEGVKSIVDAVVMPTAGWDRIRGPNDIGQHSDAFRSTVFRNASGVLRNVSSDGEYARKKLRECEGLVDSLVAIVRSAISCSDIDNKSVENCVCILRNLSYACQEIADPDYLKKRSTIPAKDNSVGCFGGKNKKKNAGKDAKANPNGLYKVPIPQSQPARGMELLWHPDIVRMYLQLLEDGTNPETLEAAAGAIQNLAACDWQPSIDIRNTIRIQKGIPIIVALVKEPSDRIVCAAATTLRNLALDEKNKQLIGKYVMHDMVWKLPSAERPDELALSNDTITAIEATLYEIIKTSSEFAKLLMQEGGIERLMHIVRSPLGIYNDKVVRYASQLLQKMWNFTEFHEEYKRKGWKQSDFGGGSGLGRSLPPSAENTINRTRMGQSGPAVPGYNDKTMLMDRHSQQQRQYAGGPPTSGAAYSVGPNTDSRLNMSDPYSSQNRMRENIPLTRMEYPTDSSREILYYNSTDRIPQDPEERHNFPPGYDLPPYPAEPPKYEADNYLDHARGYAAPGDQSDRYSARFEDSYGSQARPHSRDPASNSFDSQNPEIGYRPGYNEYPTLQTRDQEPLYTHVQKQDHYNGLLIEGADNKGQDVDSWV